MTVVVNLALWGSMAGYILAHRGALATAVVAAQHGLGLA
jgi:hypothetical protein